ncbi:MAG: hypothetical protein IT425_08285 [Pirellulales bacterium]|nr:hypothetical protein [Pirellulales bacterium]
MQRGHVGISLIIITVGVGWLLSVQNIGPAIDWVWTLGLGIIGVATFVVSGGIDKASVIFGPLFLACSVLSILRQTGRIRFDTEVPILVILLGVLLFVSQLRVIPAPHWFDTAGEKRRGRED